MRGQINGWMSKRRYGWVNEKYDEQKKEWMSKRRNGWVIVGMWWSNEEMLSAIEEIQRAI
jgi:hypothetical protein